MPKTDLEQFLEGYIECALWASNDESRPDGGDPLDKNYSADDIADETREKMRADCERFMKENAATLKTFIELLVERPFFTSSEGTPLEWAGRDFWLTRNGHGAGFWDRGCGASGESLTDACKKFGEMYLYLGDDGKIYQ